MNKNSQLIAYKCIKYFNIIMSKIFTFIAVIFGIYLAVDAVFAKNYGKVSEFKMIISGIGKYIGSDEFMYFMKIYMVGIFSLFFFLIAFMLFLLIKDNKNKSSNS